MFYTTNYFSPICKIMLLSDGESLLGLWLEGQKYYGSKIIDTTTQKDDLPLFYTVKDWLDRYFDGQNPSSTEIPLAPIGNDFRKCVWDLLTKIPYGKYTTYGDIAKKTAEKMNKVSMSSQAIGGAVGHNPISIIVPCHRVVGANGSLTGYGGGIEKKIKLLELEGVDMSHLYVPLKGTAL